MFCEEHRAILTDKILLVVSPFATHRTVHPDVPGISFTGGTVTGKKIAGSAGPKLKKLQLELGGKNPTIVFKDCYFEETLQGVAFAGLANTV